MSYCGSDCGTCETVCGWREDTQHSVYRDTFTGRYSVIHNGPVVVGIATEDAAQHIARTLDAAIKSYGALVEYSAHEVTYWADHHVTVALDGTCVECGRVVSVYLSRDAVTPEVTHVHRMAAFEVA